LLIRDLSSTNGTYVNGQRITAPTPINDNDLIQFADLTFRIRRQDTEIATQTQVGASCDQAMSLVQFDRIMSEQAVQPFYQAIVNLHDRQAVGYEVLGRSNVFGLETAGALFRAAAQLDLEVELSRMFRWEGIRCVSSLPGPPHLFVNTHPKELEKPGLIESLQAVRDVTAHLSLTLEIHEAAVTDAKQMRQLRAELSELNIRLAYDDFGAGQNRLLELIEVRPDYLKFDMSWVREINTSPERRHVLSLAVRMTRELNIVPLAEGIETEEEHQACCEIGFELAQGFLYGKPVAASNINANVEGHAGRA
jgi:EAL domain-containing protein (putative c-di-GMP-specific phosphodiesterase class I)